MLFTFDESTLLSELETNPTLADLSKKLGKDPSVISRDLKRISEKAPVIEKINSRWVLTPMGSNMALWAKKISIEQNEILGRDYTLTIATTREFASRILAYDFETFLNDSVRFKIITCEEGIEEALLKGIADFGFDCGRPSDPMIAFNPIIEEAVVTVSSTHFLKKNKCKKMADLKEEDFLYYSRLSPLQCKNINVKNAKVISNDIAVIRSLVLSHHGWATLPYYSVKKEITSKDINIVRGGEIKGYKFGVWHLRGRDSLIPWIKKAEAWLTNQALNEI
ncbi:MAG: LysR family transcriptional regulator substrate-binding protein [Bacteriovoracaceae bacterium]